MKPRVVKTSIFVESPKAGTAVTGGSYYTKPQGVDMMSLHTYSSRSDILSHEFYRFSSDNGKTWSEPTLIPAGEETPNGTRRRHARGGYLDPGTGRFLKIRNEAVLPNDEVHEFLLWNTVHYAVSEDGGRTDLYDVPLVQDGDQFDKDHPLPNVTRGRNCFMLGDATCMPITLSGYRWYAVSEDEGKTWTDAEPWRYRNGDVFHSPSSCSQLVRHSNGEIYWIGNICTENPRGNLPRYPITIGRVDQESGHLIEETVINIDDRRPGDGEFLTMSNFYAREDRVDGTIKLHMLRHSRGESSAYQGDCMLYEIAVE